MTDVISLKAAFGYTYVLRADHTIALWGNNSNGQLDAPTNLINVVAISAGYYMPLALTSDGRVHVWGAGGHVSQSQIITPPPTATNVVAISGGMAHCLALRADGTVVAWGDDLFGEADVPPGLTNVVQIAAGQAYSLAITASGQIVDWGDRSFYGPIPPGATNLVAVSIGVFGHAVALRADGTVVAWGNNSAGQATVPPGLSNIVAIATGDQHSIALAKDGSLTAWGANDAGQATVPPNFVAAKAVAAGSQHNVVISDAPLIETVSPDQFVTAGTNLVLQATVSGSMPWSSAWLKDTNYLAQTNATLTVLDVQAAAAGIYTFIASNAFGMMISQGINVSVAPSAPHWNQQPLNQAVLPGQTATFFADVSGSEPLQFQWSHNGTQILGATNATLQISSASPGDEGAYTVVVSNDYGSISNTPCYLATTLPRILAEPSNMRARTNWFISLDVSVLSPLPVTYRWFKDGVAIANETGASLGFRPVVASDAGDYFVEVSNQNGSVRSDPVHLTILPDQPPAREPGAVVEWGYAPYAQPSALSLETNVVGLAVGTLHTLILRNDGSLRLWGNPQDLTLGNIPPEATNIVALFSAPDFCLALRQDAKLVAWGGNAPGLSVSLSSPGNSGIIAAAGGPGSCITLKRDGSVTLFPETMYVPGNVTNIISVAVTPNYAAAVEANGKVLAWPGQVPAAAEIPGLSDVTAIAGGENYSSVGLRSDGTVVEFAGSYGPFSWSVVPGISNAVAIAGGRGFAALLSNGDVVSWETQGGTPPAGLHHVGSLSQQLMHVAALTSAPYFDTQPQARTFYADQTVTLTTAVRSATPFSLQWYLESVPLPGATSPVLQFSSARPSQSGHYKLVAANSRYSTESDAVLVSIEGPADFLQASASQTVPAGGTLQLQVQYVANPPGLAQWWLNGLPIPGATNGSLVFPDAQAWMNGNYNLTVSNAYGIASSPVMSVTVVSQPPTIVTQPSLPGPVPDGSAVSLTVVASGSEPLNYQWFFNQALLPGRTSPSLSLAPVSSSNAGSYAVVISNGFGSVTSAPVLLTTTRSAPDPQITPPHLLVRSGHGFQLQATARGTPGSTLQWRFNGQDLDGQTNSLLSIPSAFATNGGAYSVVAVNSLGTNESSAALLRVLPNPGAGLIRAWGFIKGNPDTLLVEAVAAGSRHALALLPDGTLTSWGANDYLQSTVPAGLSNIVAIAAGQEFSLALRNDGSVVGWGRNDSGQTVPPATLTDGVAIAGGTSHAVALKADGSVISWGNTNYARIPTNLPALASISASAGYTLALASNGTLWAWGAPSPLSLTNVPATITNAVAVAAGGTAYALDSSGLPVGWPVNPARPPDATNLVSIASGLSHGAGLRADGKLFAWGTDTYGQVSGTRGVSNLLAVAAGDLTTLGLSGDPKILSPQIFPHVKQGDTVVLSANAVGAAPLSFLWSLNGQPVPSATNLTLAINSFGTNNVGTYSFQVKNGFSAVSSNLAILSLGLPPTITTQPLDQTVPFGSNATFTVQCSGTPFLLYQWSLNGTNLLGATSSSLVLTNLVLSDQGTFTVAISNLFGSTVSRAAALVVLPPKGPGPLGLTVANGSLDFHMVIQPNRPYSLLSSTNLVDWVPWQSINSSTTNLDLFLSPDSNAPTRFYRLETAP